MEQFCLWQDPGKSPRDVRADREQRWPSESSTNARKVPRGIFRTHANQYSGSPLCFGLQVRVLPPSVGPDFARTSSASTRRRPTFRAVRSTLAFRSGARRTQDRKSTRLNSSHTVISYAVFCLKKKDEPHPVTRCAGP